MNFLAIIDQAYIKSLMHTSMRGNFLVDLLHPMLF